LTLLPVHPPEIDPFIFKWVMDRFEIGFEEFPVGGIKRDWLDVSMI